jgi:hypothetical protein
LTVTDTGLVQGETESVLGGTLSLNTTATLSSPATTYPITASGLTAANYTISYQPGTLTVNPAPLTVTAQNESRVYGDANPAFTASYSGFVLGEDESVLTGTLSYTAPGPATAPGLYPVVPGGLASPNYAIDFVGGTLTITRAPVTVTANPASRTYGGADPAFTATYTGLKNGETAASLGWAPTFSTTAVAASVPGTYPITPAGLVSGNYTFTYADGTLTITPASLTVKANDASRYYGGVDPVYSVTVTGLVAGDTTAALGGTLSFSTTAVAASVPGIYPVTPAGYTSTNYTITFANGNLSVNPAPLTVKADNKSKVYGSANPTFTATYTGFVLGDDAADLVGTLSLSTAATAASGVGTYDINASGLTSTNYVITHDKGTLTVTPAGLTVTAENKSKVYGQVNPAFTVTYAGFVGADDQTDLTGTLAFAAIDPTSGVGTYEITPSGLTSPNYTIAFVKGSLSVTPAALTVTAENRSKVYGQPNPAFTVTYTGLQWTDSAASLTGPLTFAAIDETSGVGSYELIPSGLSSNNYTISFVKGSLSVTPAALTVTAENKSKVYGQANPAFTVAYTGFQWTDGAASLTGPLAFAAIDEKSGVGTYEIVPSGLSSNNYTISFMKGSLSITPAALTVTAENKSKVYGEVNPAFGVTYGTFQWDDDAADLTGPLAFAAIDPKVGAGTYEIVPSGLSSPNYTISFVDGTLTVTKAPLTVTAVDKSKVYGQANPALTASYTGFVWGDDETDLTGPLSLTTAATLSSPAGTYTITPAGYTSANYTITFTPGTLTVTRAPLTVTTNAATKLYGAANPAFDVSYTGLVLGETDAVLTGPLTFVTAATESSPVGTYPVTPAGLTSPNYTITFAAGNLSVDKAPLTVRAVDKIRVFGAANPTLTASYTGLVLGQTEAVLGGTLDLATTATAASPVGEYPITVTGLTSANYDISFTPGKLTVTNATLTIRAEDKSRVFGEANPALTVTYTGFVGGDTTAVLSGTLATTTAATTASPVGAYAITPSGLTASNYVLVFEPGTLTITPRTLTVSTGNDSREYGSPNPPFSGSVTGAAAGDTIVGSFSTAATVTSPAGQYPITASAVAVSGNLSNYTVVSSNGTLTVRPAPLTVQVTDAVRTYGDANPTFQAVITGLKNGDQVEVSYSTTATERSRVGTYPVTGQVVGGGSANYTVTVKDGTLTVRPAALSVVAENAVKAEGEPNPPLKGTLTGVLAGDAIHADFTTTATKDSVPGSYPITPELRDPRGMLRNYTVSSQSGTLTVTRCDAVTGQEGDRTVTNNRCRSSKSVEEEVLGAMDGAQSAALVSTTLGMVRETLEQSRANNSDAPPRVVMVADGGDAEVFGGIIGMPAVQLLAEAGGELQVQTQWGSLLVSAETLQQFAGENQNSRMVILFREAAAEPTRDDMAPASPVVEVTIALLAGDGTVTQQSRFVGGLVLDLPVTGGENGEAPDLELAGIYHFVEDEDGKILSMEYVGGDVDEETGHISGYTEHLSKYGVVIYDREYDDVAPEHWAYRAVKVMTARHVVQGVSETLFDPDRSVTRAEFAAMIARAFRVQALPVAARPFADVAPDAWHAGIMKAVVEAGLFTPEAGNTLRPDEAITREEMAVVIARAMERFYPQAPLPTPDVEQVLAPFADQAQVSQASRDEFARLVVAGLVRGRTAVTLAPQGTTTRAEAVTLIKRLTDWGKQAQ